MIFKRITERTLKTDLQIISFYICIYIYNYQWKKMRTFSTIKVLHFQICISFHVTVISVSCLMIVLLEA